MIRPPCMILRQRGAYRGEPDRSRLVGKCQGMCTGRRFSNSRHAISVSNRDFAPEKHQRLLALLKSESVRREYRLGFDPTFSHSFCLRGVASIRPAYALTKRADVGATDPILLARQWRLTTQSKHRFASLLHLPLIIAQAWKARSWGHSKKENPTHGMDRSRLRYRRKRSRFSRKSH